MNTTLLTSVFVCCVSVSFNLQAQKTPANPDLTALQARIVTLVSQEWMQFWVNSHTNSNTYTNPSLSHLQRIDIKMICRADSLLTDIPLRLDKVNPLKDAPVYLVNAVADTAFWQTTTEHVLVLQHRQGEWKVLLHFVGGKFGRGMDMQLIDLGVSSLRQAILIEDYACGNSESRTRTFIYRYAPSQERLVEIFNQLTTWLPSVIPVVYKSTISLEGSRSDLKDIVVHTKFIRQDDIGDKPEPPTMSVFTWDGKSYVGRMKTSTAAPD